MQSHLLWATLVGIALLSDAASGQESALPNRPTAEIALSDETLQLRYASSGEAVGVAGSRVSGTFFLSEERDIVLSGALLFPANLDLGRVSISVGPQLYAALLEEENNDVMSISVGTEIRLLLNERMGLAVSGQAFYAPDILTFGSADNLTDLSARVELGIASRVIVFGGMRWFEFDLTDDAGERTLQEELFVGFGYRF
jgi:hypothetical protein